MKPAQLLAGLLLGTLLTLATTATIAQVVQDNPPGKLPKLFKPYSLMTTLDPETVLAIDARHDETLAAIKQLKAAEYEDIQAMLSDEQKAELAAVEAKMKAERDAYIQERQRRKLEERQKDKKDEADNEDKTDDAEQ
ncbi:MAG: hypothetical protein AAF743_00275 [Planctomycetota bacterium]